MTIRKTIEPYDHRRLVMLEVTDERQAQLDSRGHNGDDQHVDFELVDAAVSYATHCLTHPIVAWPTKRWNRASDNHRRNCVRAAALLCAEIERLDREKYADD